MDHPALGEALISIQDLSYTYADGTRALDGIDFSLYGNECVILLGANGSGKTTFLLHLNGILIGEGAIKICGLSVNPQNIAQIRRSVGIVFQDPDDQIVMPTVLDDVAFGLLNAGKPRTEALQRAREILAEVGLSEIEEKVPHHLSFGEKRRVALAGVLAMAPELLVLDEPSTFLDPPGQRHLTMMLQKIIRPKIIATHDLSLARQLGTRALFFDQGRIVGNGPVERVIEQFKWHV